MIPNPAYVPYSLQERAAWFKNFNDQMQLIGASLGFTPAELTILEKDNDIIQFLAETDVTINAYTDAARNYRKVITEGDIGNVQPDFPPDMSFTLPAPVPTGIFERLDLMVKRIRVAPKYTEETGAALGIIALKKDSDLFLNTTPVITATVDPGNVVEVKFVKGGSSGIYIDTNVDNGGWHFTDKAVKSPAVITVPNSTNDAPRSVQIRARYLDGNNPVGDWSDIVTVQTIP